MVNNRYFVSSFLAFECVQSSKDWCFSVFLSLIQSLTLCACLDVLWDMDGRV